MSNPYLGEIRIFAGNFAPVGWAFCAGQVMSIAENDALFALIGTTYGGDGQTTFNLPDLRGRIPIHQGTGHGSNFVLGQLAGSETVTLSLSQLPAHNHPAQATAASGSKSTPGGNVWAGSTLNSYSTGAPKAQMNPHAIGNTGNGQPHDNLMPYLAVNFIIALEGVFPSQN